MFYQPQLYNLLMKFFCRFDNHQKSGNMEVKALKEVKQGVCGEQVWLVAQSESPENDIHLVLDL